METEVGLGRRHAGPRWLVHSLTLLPLFTYPLDPEYFFIYLTCFDFVRSI